MYAQGHLALGLSRSKGSHMWHLNLTSAFSTWAICETFSFISSNKGSGSRIPLFRAFLLNPRGEVVSGNPMNDDGTGGATERWRE